MRFSDIVFPLSLAFATVSAGVVDSQVATLQNERSTNDSKGDGQLQVHDWRDRMH
jgi:hypothetical protein